MLSTTFLLHSSCGGVSPSALVDGVACYDAISIDLRILFHEQLDVFVDRQVDRHLTDCIPSCSLNNVFHSVLLEAIIHVLLRDIRTLVMPRYIAILIQTNMSVENQNKLET